MPKLSEEFHQPRLDAYRIAINALADACEYEHHLRPLSIECAALAKKLERERAVFAQKFELVGS